LPGTLANWVVVALLLFGATALGLVFERQISLTSQAMLYVLAVVIVSYLFGWKESVACAAGAVTALNFFFVPPRWTFEVESREHLITLFTMLLVALVISHLAAGLRRETAVARLNEQRARQLQGLATDLSAATSERAIVALGHDALNQSFDGPCALVTCLPDGTLVSEAKLESAMTDGLKCCMREAAVLGPGTGRWPGLNAWYLPLGEKGRMNGAACVQPALASDEGGREHAQALCALLAQALWRLGLASSMLAAQGEVQRQQIQNTFLAAISHDLRTPLAAVVGAASSLQTQRGKLSSAEQDRLLESIVSEASYLCTVTENTLQLVRLANSAQELQRDWESMEEIVGAVLARVRRRDPARRIKSSVQKGLPLIKGDPVLLAQLLENLLDNALKYSSEAIDLTVSVAGEQLMVSVKDRGAGIPVEKTSSIFEPYSRSDQSGQHGSGLGLAVCRAVAQAHGGTLALRQRRGGGSSFSLSLHVDTQELEDVPA
jgi:two-component system sensor histidine kinase KdpD